MDYFGRRVEPAAQADAILWIRTTIAFTVGGHGRSIIAWDSFVRRPRDSNGRLIDRALDDATGMRARRPPHLR